MFWFKRFLILLFIVLQPLRGVAEVHAAVCDNNGPERPAQSVHSCAGHAHQPHDSSADLAAKMNGHGDDHCAQHEHQHQHGKSCTSCCPAGAAPLSAELLHEFVPAFAAPLAHRAGPLPPTPVENQIRPPIA